MPRLLRIPSASQLDEERGTLDKRNAHGRNVDAKPKDRRPYLACRNQSATRPQYSSAHQTGQTQGQASGALKCNPMSKAGAPNASSFTTFDTAATPTRESRLQDRAERRIDGHEDVHEPEYRGR